MLRDFLTNKWVLGGIGFLIVFAVACVLWYQHDTADERKAAAEAEKLLRQSELSQETDTDGETEQAADVVSVESNTPTAEKPITDTPVTKNIEPTQAQNETETTELAEVPVSPHGFGPYPEVPDDYPLNPPVWLNNPTGVGIPDHAAGPVELLDRVLVKLWKQGHKNITGASTAFGKIYPHYTDVVYVRYKDIQLPDGTVNRFITRIKTGPDLAHIIPQIQQGNTPPGIKLVEFKDAGIDPHTFLKKEN